MNVRPVLETKDDSKGVPAFDAATAFRGFVNRCEPLRVSWRLG